MREIARESEKVRDIARETVRRWAWERKLRTKILQLDGILISWPCHFYVNFDIIVISGNVNRNTNIINAYLYTGCKRLW